jgi:hypothetical protein
MSVADKLKQWTKEPLSRAVDHLTIDEVDDLAVWRKREEVVAK